MSTATVHTARNALETFTLSIEPIIWPHTLLANDVFHSLKPHRHCRVIIWEIEILQSVVDSTGSVMHFQPILSVSPDIFWVFWHLSSRNSITGMTLIAWGIIEKKRPVTKPFIFDLKISIDFSTCLSRSSAENHLSQFFLALKTP